jgi:hypothetical protein
LRGVKLFVLAVTRLLLLFAKEFAPAAFRQQSKKLDLIFSTTRPSKFIIQLVFYSMKKVLFELLITFVIFFHPATRMEIVVGHLHIFTVIQLPR